MVPKFGLLLAASLAIAISLCSFAAAKDAAGSKDHPMVGRYEGSSIERYKQSDFDEVALLKGKYDSIASDKGASVFEKSRGRTTTIVYTLPQDRSALEVMENLKGSIVKKGDFQTIFECSDEECTTENDITGLGNRLSDGVVLVYANGAHGRYLLGKLSAGGTDYMISLFVAEGSTEPAEWLRVVELKGMETGKIKFVDAGAMKTALNNDGRIALYGIYFDTDKDVPKPESDKTIGEISKLLNETPDLKIIVAGHTDNQGDFKYNVDLSQRRARSIVAALNKNGIAADRLLPFGAGMAAPVASNDNDAGRAKNRRVELVKK